MATYVISDIHGYYTLFQRLLQKIKFSASDTLYILGDNFDRGGENLAMYDFIKANKNVTSLMGNHELLLMNEIYPLLSGELKYNESDWMCNGGLDTLKELMARESEQAGFLRRFVSDLRKWKYHKVIEFGGVTYILVHAGYRVSKSTDPETVLCHTTREDRVWLREEFIYGKTVPGTVTIFGHTPTISIPYTRNIGGIWHCPHHWDKIGIDCGSYRTNALGILRLDDMRAFYVGMKRNSEIINKTGLWEHFTQSAVGVQPVPTVSVNVEI